MTLFIATMIGALLWKPFWFLFRMAFKACFREVVNMPRWEKCESLAVIGFVVIISFELMAPYLLGIKL